MREIKFRVWDHERLQYLYFSGWSLDSEYDILRFDQETGYEVSDSYGNGRHGVLEQFTGLRDKNGKEIYEGDIVEWTPGESVIRSVVEFDEGGFVAGGWFLQAGLWGKEFRGKIVGNANVEVDEGEEDEEE